MRLGRVPDLVLLGRAEPQLDERVGRRWPAPQHAARPVHRGQVAPADHAHAHLVRRARGEPRVDLERAAARSARARPTFLS